MSDTVIDLLGSKLHVQRDGSGEPLLFLHGAQGLAGWEPGLQALAKGFDVMAPDHPGFGSSTVTDVVEDVPDLALFYLDLLDKLKLSRVHIVGQCIGGWIGLEMAIRSTANIKSLTLVNSAGIRVLGEPRGDMFICGSDELLGMLFAQPATGTRWLAQWQETPDLADAFERNSGAAAKFCWQPRLANLKLHRWLHRINVPTNIVWGDHAKVIPPANAKALADGIKGATMTTLRQCGHVAHFEQPQALAGEVAKVARRAAS